MRCYALRDEQWERIEGLLPGREGHVGVTAKDNRLFVEAVLYRYRAGIPWRDLPERFGPWKPVHAHPVQPLGGERGVGQSIPALGWGGR
jgi:transposase